MRTYQGRVGDWMLSCFGPDVAKNRKERAYRFLEEALELAQAFDLSKEEASKLVDYVFSRPVGRPHQEVGGTMVCIAALCNADGINMEDAAEDELQRVWDIKEKIHKKWLAKQIRCADPNSEPLP